MPFWTWEEPEKIAAMCKDCDLMRTCVIREYCPALLTKGYETVLKVLEDDLIAGGESAMKVIGLAGRNYNNKKIKNNKKKKEAKSAERAGGWDKNFTVGRYKFSVPRVTGEFSITKISKAGFATIVPHDERGTKPHRRYLKKEMPFYINFADGGFVERPVQITWGNVTKV